MIPEGKPYIFNYDPNKKITIEEIFEDLAQMQQDYEENRQERAKILWAKRRAFLVAHIERFGDKSYQAFIKGISEPLI